MPRALQQFYIPEEQSVYLLSHQDARKLKEWVALCQVQLGQLGFEAIELIGKGAYGFVFAGRAEQSGVIEHYVFKFSRITLPTHLQERLEEEAFMLEQIRHPRIPQLIAYQRIHGQSILVMERAPGLNLEEISLRQGRLSPRLIVRLGAQLADILLALRRETGPNGRPLVHGDIKPSNLVFDVDTETVALIDWGSSVFAQLDAGLQPVGNNVMELMSNHLQQTNARLGDVYFIGEEQLNGALSSPRFDEQGVAGTLYALASVSRLGKYPVVGGLAIRWEAEGIHIDSSLNLHDPAQKPAFTQTVNNMVHLARAIHRQGVFKSCLFNARFTATTGFSIRAESRLSPRCSTRFSRRSS